MSDSNVELSRAQWGSRFGFLMAMLGAMVGAGNIWRFPYIAGEQGGGAFILAYLALLIILAIPGLIAEVALGRYTGRGVIGAFRKIVDSRGLVGLGVVVLLVNVVLMSYYAPVVGWTLYYAVHSLLLTFSQAGFSPEAFWQSFQNSLFLNIGMHTTVMAMVAGVLYFGIRRGIERLVVYAVPGLILALLAITIRALTLPGAAEGLIFTFDIDWGALARGETWVTALGQALFSTGLGWGIALTIGSYLPKYDDIPIGGGLFTVIGNSSVGLLAAFAIFPIVFAYGVDPASGSELTFVSLPQVFPQMAGGALWAILFFIGFFLATFTSAILITEVGVTTLNEETNWSREQTVFGVCGGIWLIGLASVYSSAVFGFLDFVFGNFGLPLATLSIIGAIGWSLTPEKLRVLEVNRNAGIYVGPLWNPIIKYVIPVVMLFILGNYAWANFGSIQMIGGVIVLITFPLIGYGLMHLIDDPREYTHSQ
ncbi:neurotransmitter:Na+ symporter, NSS family protein [Salinibacter sp. 10B]|uniref:sodium-dependent transporter n=1 Tax=Salinibacter sp. 10B TaxID=1923971 RepID=UPI000CF3DBC2|nr:sodium-dependent transporter [Salinibacter sp. 10B]PQJ36233.1 neurotransmitter:Na+ symporter, NSS family protein [Salinibacter sp. 10B]